MRTATDEKKASEAAPGAGIDRSTIRRLLDLTPAERIRLAVEEARNLARFDRAMRRWRSA